MEEDRRHHLGLVINLDSDDDVGQSSRPHGRRGDAGQGYNYIPQLKKEEPDDDMEDYVVAMYHRLGLGCGSGDY
ncbi:hypothetical protein QYE76_055186 [Lolium multiflorum]|uniref:Uncharacterized protein n=1 Tax=Lolium multiflorum TaxID=4521 RepID=A0AAD8WLL1_LOLMU|nr:hypothetical protein QYE76_055186 [Lolium multiflorum]